ncbi:MAG TPA: peroxidase, partial [Telluria sp.]
RMFVGDPAGHYDRLLDFSKAKTGATFFAPSRPTLQAIVSGGGL